MDGKTKSTLTRPSPLSEEYWKLQGSENFTVRSGGMKAFRPDEFDLREAQEAVRTALRTRWG